MSMSDRAFVLKENITEMEIYNALSERIAKATSLIRFRLFDEVLESVDNDIAHYLWLLNGLIEEIHALNDKLGDKMPSFVKALRSQITSEETV